MNIVNLSRGDAIPSSIERGQVYTLPVAFNAYVVAFMRDDVVVQVVFERSGRMYYNNAIPGDVCLEDRQRAYRAMTGELL
jgi:hypothetical protein